MMTFEIKVLVGYRLDRVDTGEGTSRGTPPRPERRGCELVVVETRETRLRTRRRLLPADVPMVWWIHGACLACLSSWWPARKTVASRPSQKPGLSSRPGQTTFFTRAASPTITQPPQWKHIGNARRQTMGCARPRPVLPGRVCETSSTSGVRSTRRLRVAASRNA